MRELTVLEEPSRWNHSFSSINTFLTICERRYAVEKLTPWEDSLDSLRGGQIHDALERWASFSFLEKGYERALADTDGPLSTDELRVWTDQVKEVCANLKPIQQEFWFRMPLAGCKRKLVGKVDLKSATGPDGSEGNCLVDWKSTKSMSKFQTAYEMSRNLQARIYSLATGVRRVAMVWFTQYHKAEYALTEFTDEQIEQTRRFVEHTCQVIESRWKTQDWRLAFPNTGLCSPRWCGEYERCYGGE